MIRVIKGLSIFFLVSIWVTNCTSTRSSIDHSQNKSLSGIFNITEEKAYAIILKSLEEVMGGSPVSRVTSPHKGYQSTLRFLLDSHNIAAFMIPVTLVDSQGEKINGYSFQVRDSGTMPILGGAKAEKLLNKIIDHATSQSEIIIPGEKFSTTQPVDEDFRPNLSEKLTELKEAYDNNLISKEEYELKRKDIIDNH